MPATEISYVGRFAPSPTGPLHFGSLVSAVASYLDAHSHGGKWLVRMEDIDPPREQPGAADIILRQLQQHGLCWDGEVLYQSSRIDVYRDILASLKQQQLAYPCTCSRQQLASAGGLHLGACRASDEQVSEPHAWRLQVGAPDQVRFMDLLQGEQQQSIAAEIGDFVLLRKDGLFAYQLAVVADEQQQGITHIIRGADLLDSTPRQIYLQRLLGYRTPVYGHVPLAVDDQGNKLSKQNLAPSLDTASPPQNLTKALAWLAHPVPEELRDGSVERMLAWAVSEWDRAKLSGVRIKQITEE